MTVRINKWVLAVAALLALTLFFAGGTLTGYLYAREETPRSAAAVLPNDTGGAVSDEELWKPFRETYDLINKEFYGRPVDKKKLVQAATDGMVKSLGDPYTTYLPPQQRQQLREDMSGQFQGIGVYVDIKNKQFVIVAPIEGSPAARAGLQRGDVIVAVNGQNISGMDQMQVIGKIRGPKGTSVKLKIKRGNKPPFDVNVLRDEIQVAQVEYKLVQKDIAYISANIFGDKTTAELDKALQQAKKDGARGIILDLRDNGGGWVTAAQEMVGRFVPNGVALYDDFTKGPGGEHPKEVITGDVNAYDVPMVVLVNKGSASASEIVAGALQARERAKLVGDVTFGKGSEQNVHDLSGGASAHVTIAHWLTPDKRDIHGKGLTPDYLVKTGQQDIKDAGPQFQKAVEFLRTIIK